MYASQEGAIQLIDTELLRIYILLMLNINKTITKEVYTKSNYDFSNAVKNPYAKKLKKSKRKNSPKRWHRGTAIGLMV